MMSPAANPTISNDIVIVQLQDIAHKMSAWLKLLGVSSMFMAALWIFSIIGTLFAWIPLWQGILLYQAGNRSNLAATQQQPAELLVALERLRYYFMVSGVLTLFFLALTLVFLFFVWISPETGSVLVERYWLF